MGPSGFRIRGSGYEHTSSAPTAYSAPLTYLLRPTLVVHGMGSMIPIESQRWIADAIAGGQFATIPADEGGSHFVFWENAERFSEIVGNFLDRTDGLQ